MRGIRHVTALLLTGALALPLSAQSKPGGGIGARLVNQVAANPQSVAANRALGIWYYKAGRFAEARVPLEKARRLDPRDGVSALYAGLAAEQLHDYAAAAEAYNAYLAVGTTKRVRDDVRVRLLTVTKEEAKAAAKEAVAREGRVAQVAGSPTTVAVLPFAIGGADSSLFPLRAGLADLVVSDLAKPRQLTVVERDKLQAITDEIALAASGQVDASTAVRAGRLVQAGTIVQGALIPTGGGQVTMTSTLVNTQNAETVGRGSQESGLLDNLFNLEKRLVFATFADLGITLTPAERQDVDRRPTRSLQAFLSYSRGLMAEDRGRLDEAARLFDDAHSLDPGFGAALQRAQSDAAQSRQTTAGIESNLRGSAEGRTVAAAERGAATSTALAATLGAVVGDVNPTTTNTIATTGATTTAAPSTRPAAAEATGTDQPARRTGQVTIVVRKP